VGLEGKRTRSVSARAVRAAEDVSLSIAGKVLVDLGGDVCCCSGASRRRRVRLDRKRGTAFVVCDLSRYVERTGGVVKDDCGVRLRSAVESSEALSGSSVSLAVSV
jgi:hypothetical protein